MAYKSPIKVSLPQFTDKTYGSSGAYANPKTVVNNSSTEAETILKSGENISEAMHSVGVSKNLKNNNESSKSVNPAAEAREKGRQDRRVERQTQRAKRITARNEKRLERTKQRQERKNNRFNERNPESPVNFIASTAASLASPSIGEAVNELRAFEKFRNYQRATAGSSFAGAASQAVRARSMNSDVTPQATAGNKISGKTINASNTDNNPFAGQKYQLTPVQMTYEPPTPSNEKGEAKPLFSPQVQASAEYIYGTPEQRQMSVPGSAMYFKDQTGDGKITQADVIKARTKGYKK